MEKSLQEPNTPQSHHHPTATATTNNPHQASPQAQTTGTTAPTTTPAQAPSQAQQQQQPKATAQTPVTTA